MSQSTQYVAKIPDHRGMIAYSAEENETWSILMARQMARAGTATCAEFAAGLAALDLPHKRAAQCREVSDALMARTGWQVVPVSALIEIGEFYRLLSCRQFPAASFVRRPDELDYLREPDLFHEIFGHAPLLMDPRFARFTQDFGRLGLAADSAEREVLSRLYWFTVEFGLICRPGEGLRVLGAGIASSIRETDHALSATHVERRPFDLEEILRTDYRIDRIQPTYFVLDSLEQLYATLDGDLMARVQAVCAATRNRARSAA